MLSLREFDSTVRRGLLLTYVGESTNDIFDILPDTGTTYQAAIDALTQHFTPQGNNDDMAIFDFRELKQGVTLGTRDVKNAWDFRGNYALLARATNKSVRTS